jgi:hypothetical protein
MILNPDFFVDEFAQAGTDTFLVHWEGNNDLSRTVQRIKASGRRVGVAINPATPAAVLEEIMQDLDQVLVMTVNPGFGHQHFLNNTLPKIRRAREMIDQVAGVQPRAGRRGRCDKSPRWRCRGADVLARVGDFQSPLKPCHGRHAALRASSALTGKNVMQRMIGLGRMGANMVRRLIKGGYQCVVFDMSPGGRGFGAGQGGRVVARGLVRKLAPRAVWLMVPQGRRQDHRRPGASPESGDILMTVATRTTSRHPPRSSLRREGSITWMWEPVAASGVWSGYCMMADRGRRCDTSIGLRWRPHGRDIPRP